MDPLVLDALLQAGWKYRETRLLLRVHFAELQRIAGADNILITGNFFTPNPHAPTTGLAISLTGWDRLKDHYDRFYRKDVPPRGSVDDRPAGG